MKPQEIILMRPSTGLFSMNLLAVLILRLLQALCQPAWKKEL